MNILEEYTKRNNLNCSIAHHVHNSSLLILKADRKKWGSNWCVFTVIWEPNPFHPGSYKMYLRSPNYYPKNQDIWLLSKSHWFLEKSWSDYERFFFEWKPMNKNLQPVFDEEAFLAAWEIFLLVHENWFISQTLDFKKRLYKTMSSDLGFSERINFCNEFINSEPFSSSLFDTWNKNFYLPIKNSYLNWFKDFR